MNIDEIKAATEQAILEQELDYAFGLDEQSQELKWALNAVLYPEYGQTSSPIKRQPQYDFEIITKDNGWAVNIVNISDQKKYLYNNLKSLLAEINDCILKNQESK